jgi:hypothetical protein
MKCRLPVADDYTGKTNGTEKESDRHDPSGVLLN